MILSWEKFCDRYQSQRKLSNKPGRQTILAKDLLTQELVVVKILWFHDLFEWTDLKLFEREAKTIRHLDHPAIPQYLDYFEIEQDGIHGFALVQTYIDAPSLATTIEQGRSFSEEEVIELAAKLLEILTYLHQQHPPVIHRDIKPSNLLITNRTGNSVGEVYLVDLGSVQTTANKDEGTFTVVGSYGYVPLEQFGGRAISASDLYSLGMTLIYVLTGVSPAELPLIKGRVDYSQCKLSGKFDRWLEKITHPHAEQRFDSAHSAHTALLSEDGSTGDLQHLRPENTAIKVYRDRHKLEITYPAKPESLSDIGCLIAFMLWIPSFYFIGGFALLLLLPMAFLSISLDTIIKSFSEEKRKFKTLCIDHHGKTVVTDRSWKSDQIVKEETTFIMNQISFVVYDPGYTFDRYIDSTGKTIRRGKVEVKSQLSIHANSSRYIGCIRYPIGYYYLSQAELWWLGHEICDFLVMELQVIHETPKVPSAPA